MFILYAILVGLVAGFLFGGRLEGLASLGFRWAPLAIVALLVQIAIFGPLGDLVGGAGSLIYVASTVAVLVAVIRNIRIPGLAPVVVGAIMNLAAIAANGGIMPADAGALAVAGLEPRGGFSNSAVLAAPALRPLTDILALPSALPFANVFSVGDVLIGLGIAITIAVGMRRKAVVRVGTSYD